jgi:hypothetical protein
VAENEALVPDAPSSPRGRILRLTGAAALLLGAVLAARVALPLVRTSYATPGPQGSTNSNAAPSGVGVAASVMGVLAAVCALGWLVWNVRRHPPARLWALVGGLVLVSALVDVIASNTAEPNY